MFSIPPPSTAMPPLALLVAVLLVMRLCSTVSAPWLRTPPPQESTLGSLASGQSADRPPLMVAALIVRAAPLATFRMRKLGADALRLIVAPRPLMVMLLVMAGRPFAPLSGATSVYVQPLARFSASAPGVLLAVLIAETSAGTEHGTPEAPAAWAEWPGSANTAVA